MIILVNTLSPPINGHRKIFCYLIKEVYINLKPFPFDGLDESNKEKDSSGVVPYYFYVNFIT